MGGSESEKLQAEVSSLVSILQGSKPDRQEFDPQRSRSREPLRRKELRERPNDSNGVRERSDRDRDRELPRRVTRSEGRDGRDGRDRRERREIRGEVRDARDGASRRHEGRDRERRDGRDDREERDRHDRHDRSRPPIERRPSHRERSRSGYERSERSIEHRERQGFQGSQGAYASHAAPLTRASQPEDLRGDRLRTRNSDI